MKGVLLSRAPNATIVDISHQIAPGDIRAGQYLLGRAWKAFPAGTVHLAVVDPGVGTDARAIGAESSGHRFLGPDNGLLSFLPQDGRFFSLPIPPCAAPTFHGRAVFAPAAASAAVAALCYAVQSPDAVGTFTLAMTRSANPALGANCGSWTSSRMTLRSRSASTRHREHSAR